jgi:hypothetical protein
MTKTEFETREEAAKYAKLNCFYFVRQAHNGKWLVWDKQSNLPVEFDN